MPKSDWMLYGANGYTGRLIAEEAAHRGMRPILAGRSAAPVEKLAADLGLASRIFPLDGAADRHLEGCSLVLNCAGPFSATAVPMMEACLKSGVHYLDITGEIDCLEAAASMHDRALARGVVLLPAVGFDVVPTDCLAALLSARLPNAVHLELAFGGLLHISPGTTKTIVENFPRGGRARIEGRLQGVPVAWKTREIPFATGPKWGMTIPWGDVSTAYYSTGIPNIEVYVAMPRRQALWAKRLRSLKGLTKPRAVQWLLKRLVDWTVQGPASTQRQAGRVQLWGRVENTHGVAVEATMETPEAYHLTVETSLAAVEWMRQSLPAPGFNTPSKAFGSDFASNIAGVKLSMSDTQKSSQK